MHNLAEANSAFPKSAQTSTSAQSSTSKWKTTSGSSGLKDSFNEVVCCAQETFESKIRTDPFRSVAIGFGVGYILAKIIGGGGDCDDC